jgi:hypothetical protein
MKLFTPTWCGGFQGAVLTDQLTYWPGPVKIPSNFIFFREKWVIIGSVYLSRERFFNQMPQKIPCKWEFSEEVGLKSPRKSVTPINETFHSKFLNSQEMRDQFLKSLQNPVYCVVVW